jgi:hypothetical protein
MIVSTVKLTMPIEIGIGLASASVLSVIVPLHASVSVAGLAAPAIVDSPASASSISAFMGAPPSEEPSSCIVRDRGSMRNAAARNC